MVRLDRYFEGCIKDNFLFEPESKCSKKILEIISKNRLEVSDFKEIVRMFNETGEIEHYSGSGWLDYALHLSSYLESFGFEVNLISWQKIEIK